MKERTSAKKTNLMFIAGMIGTVLLAASDWLMIYGNTKFEGNLAWLTVGVANIEPWRNNLAMILAFPAIIFYAVGLYAIADFMRDDQDRKLYKFLTTIGMTPWLCLHLFYIMILYLFGYLQRNGHASLAFEVCEELFSHMGWIVIVSEVLMILPFVYIIYTIVTWSTHLSNWMALNNPLVYYLILKGITLVLPDRPFRLAFVNGLMSESMFLCFAVYLFAFCRLRRNRRI